VKCEAAVAILASEGLALVPSVTSKLEVRSFIPCLAFIYLFVCLFV